MSIAEKLVTIAENVQKVYEAGQKSSGGGAGYDEGYADGQQAEKERFFTDYQNPDQDDYDYRFAGIGWNNNTFAPRQNIAPKTRAMSMFARTGIKGDLVAILQALNVTLDFSQCKLTQNLFANANGITRLGVMDFSNMGSSYGSEFTNMNALVTIDKMITSENTSFTNMFGNDASLVNVTWEGVIAKSGLSFSKSTKLSQESIISIITALSPATTGLAITLSLASVNKAFETSEGANDGSDSTKWRYLSWSKQNWTISLV